MIIDAFSAKIAIRLKEENPDHPASVEVLTFSIAVVINIIGTLIVALSAALFLGHLWETATAMAAFAILRTISGGYHLNSSVYCILVTSLCANLIPYIELTNTTLLILTVLSMLIALRFAPSNIEQSTRIPPKFYPALKVITVLLIATNFILQSDVVAISAFLQTILLVRIRR